jgi:hypothetical protein
MFEDIGHSSEARETMKQYCIGVLKLTDEEKARLAERAEKRKAMGKSTGGGGGLGFGTVVIMILALVLGYYFSQNKSE